MRRAILALGSNKGNKLLNFRKAIKHLRDANMPIQDTSFLYLTKPLLNKDQDDFLNAAVKIQTDLSPQDLLAKLKSIEQKVGRDLSSPIYKGPREIDLDILYYDNEVIETGNLTIPHVGIPKRDFYLQPLMDLIPDYLNPKENLSTRELMDNIMRNKDDLSYPTKVLGFVVNEEIERYFNLAEHTLSFGIVNTSPESSQLHTTPDSNIDVTFNRVMEIVNANVDVLDIGGESVFKTDVVPAESEIKRISPMVRKLRSDPRTKHCIVSVDTGKADVALEELENGAHVINDFYGARWYPEMLDLAAEYQVPIVLTFGPLYKGDFSKYDDLYQDMHKYFTDIIEKCKKKGIPRWDIMIDPGFSWTKTNYQNLDILKKLRKTICAEGYPVMAAISNKYFIRDWVGVGQKDSIAGANAVITGICIEQGCEIIRIHETPLLQAMKMADLVYRKKRYW